MRMQAILFACCVACTAVYAEDEAEPEAWVLYPPTYGATQQERCTQYLQTVERELAAKLADFDFEISIMAKDKIGYFGGVTCELSVRRSVELAQKTQEE